MYSLVKRYFDSVYQIKYRSGQIQIIRLHPPCPLPARVKSMNPRSTSVLMSSTRTRYPTSRPSNPRISFPSTGGWKRRTQVPFSEAPVTMASNRFPMLAQVQPLPAAGRLSKPFGSKTGESRRAEKRVKGPEKS